MFASLEALIQSTDEAEWDSQVAAMCSEPTEARKEMLNRLHALAGLLQSTIQALEETTFELSSTMYKRKRKPGLMGASQTSKLRWCVLRTDGMHYYDKERGKLLGVIEHSSIEGCDFVEGSEKTFVVTRSNAEIVEFTAENATVARDWISALKPVGSVSLVEGFLKEKGKGVNILPRQRFLVLTKEALKVFDQKGGRCVQRFGLGEVASVAMVREGDGNAMKVVLLDGTSSVFSAASDAEATLPQQVRERILFIF